MPWFITSLGALFTKIFSSIISSGFIRSLSNSFLTFSLLKIFALFGLAFISYEGSQFLIENLFSTLNTQLQSLPNSEWVSTLFMVGGQLYIDNCLSIIFSAYSVGLAIKTMKTSKNLVSL